MKTFLRLLLLALIVAPAVLAWAAIEPAPLVSAEARATPAQVGEARSLLHRFRKATETPDVTEIEASRAELEGALMLGARLIPGLRGDAAIGPEGVRLRLSAPGSRWSPSSAGSTPRRWSRPTRGRPASPRRGSGRSPRRRTGRWRSAASPPISCWATAWPTG